jgi:hypothetical protein
MKKTREVSMQVVKKEFGERLCKAMVAAGYDAKPAVLKREFNERYLGNPVTLHGVRRWLLGEVMPAEDKLITLAHWLRIEPQVLQLGATAQTVRGENQAWETAIGAKEREIFEAFLELTAPQKKIIREVILAFSSIKI